MLIFSTWRGSFELSRKIVTRLGGVTSSLCLSFPDSKLSLASFKPFYCCFRFCSECSHSWPKPLSHFYKNFQGFTYCSVFKVLCCFATARLIYHSFSFLSTAFLFLFLNIQRCLKGRFSVCSLVRCSRSRTRHILLLVSAKVNTFFTKFFELF